jgi:ATP-dependent RNA helicase DDX5/DBP2
MRGRDLIGVAETGSGKTLAFALPTLLHVSNQDPVKPYEGPIVLIIAPVRELAQQIFDEFSKRFPNTTGAAGIRTMCIYGGGNKRVQREPLKHGVDILVATPGRLIDELDSGSINLKRCTMVIMDEADRMLDMGFEPQIRSVLGQVRPDRQLMLWSATWPREVQSIAAQFLVDPVKITASQPGLGPGTALYFQSFPQFWNLIVEKYCLFWIQVVRVKVPAPIPTLRRSFCF